MRCKWGVGDAAPYDVVMRGEKTERTDERLTVCLRSFGNKFPQDDREWSVSEIAAPDLTEKIPIEESNPQDLKIKESSKVKEDERRSECTRTFTCDKRYEVREDVL